MRSQFPAYCVGLGAKLVVFTKLQKVERLRSCLHYTNMMAQAPPNQHTIFVDSAEEGKDQMPTFLVLGFLIPVVNYARTMGVSVSTGESEDQGKEGGSGMEGDDIAGEKQGRGKRRNRKRRKGGYKELSQRVQRCKELEAVALGMKTKKDVMVRFPLILCQANCCECLNLQGKGIKWKVKGDGSHPPVYKWKLERQK